MAVSAAGVDIAFNLIFVALNGAWSFAPRSVGISVILLVGVNYLVASRLFAPIELYLKAKGTFEQAQRRITQLPLLTARARGHPRAAVTPDAGWDRPISSPIRTSTGVPRPALAQVITLSVVLPVFYFTYTYFVISDYLATLCTFIFERYGDESRPVLRQLHGQADRGPAGDLDRAAGGDPRRSLLLRRRPAASARSWSTSPRR